MRLTGFRVVAVALTTSIWHTHRVFILVWLFVSVVTFLLSVGLLVMHLKHKKVTEEKIDRQKTILNILVQSRIRKRGRTNGIDWSDSQNETDVFEQD